LFLVQILNQRKFALLSCCEYRCIDLKLLSIWTLRTILTSRILIFLSYFPLFWEQAPKSDLQLGNMNKHGDTLAHVSGQRDKRFGTITVVLHHHGK